jgi:hypothetical protein
MSDPTATETATQPSTPVESTGNASAVPPVPAPPASLTSEQTEKEIKGRLEWQIANKDVTVRFKGTKITFRKWGLRQNLRMGSKVIKLVNMVNESITDQRLLAEVSTFTQVLAFVADDVMEIVAGSISAPFVTADKAEEWLDENVENVEDLFDLAYIVYDQNLKGNALGKLTGGMESLTKKMTSLYTASSKN